MKKVDSNDITELIDYELGSRHPSSKGITNIISFIAFLWAFFQIFIASPIPFWLTEHFRLVNFVLNDFESRSIHLSFALFLAFLSFPAFHSSPHKTIPILDWIFAFLSSLSVLYLFLFYPEISERIALPTNLDLITASIGMVLLLEAARRAIGLPIVIVASLFLLYSFFGQYMPDIMAHKGQSFNSIASHEWFSSEGVFGVALGVSTSFVFLYVLFGALLDKAGAGSFFIKLSFALLGRFTGGPAKAAVVASGLMGMISGSSIANTITIGTFTIPLMRKMGLSAEKAAAIEVSSGINGQIMPPVMGAAAFLMSEFLSIPYADIVKYAFVPAILVYITLLYIVHIEARKLNLTPTLNFTKARSFYYSTLIFLISMCCMVLLCGIIYIAIEGIHIYKVDFPGIKEIFQGRSIYVISSILVFIYTIILYYQAQERKNQDEVIDESHLPDLWQTFKSGLHYLIPIFILIWCLIVERLSSALSCFWTIMFLAFMLLTQKPITSLFNHHFKEITKAFFSSVLNLYDALVSGSKNMLAIAVATGVAGIIVGSVSLTGFGLSISDFVDSLANGSLFITLVLTAIICIILGMGMPTTACYIIVSTLMVPILKGVIYQNGLDIAPVALHLFVFYFGLMADVTPPVGIASYAAAAIAKSNAFKTGMQSFIYNIRTMIVPFLFVYNNELILYNVKNIWHAVGAIFISLVGIISISAGMQGYFIRFNRITESIMLMVVGAMLLAPNYLISIFITPYQNIDLSQATNNFEIHKHSNVRITIQKKEENIKSDPEERKILLHAKSNYEGTLCNILDKLLGVVTTRCGSSAIGIRYVENQSVAQHFNLNKIHVINKIELSKKEISIVYLHVAAFLIIAVVYFIQKRQVRV